MTLSARIGRMEESLTLAMAQKARELKAAGRETLNLSAGEPDFDVPQVVKEEAIAAINGAFNKYTAVSGTDELKAAIAGKLKRDNNLDYSPKNIVVSSGAKHSLFQLFAVLADFGDEVIIPAPAWVSYPEMARYHGAKAVLTQTKAENGFKITSKELEAALSDKTKIVVIGSPSNPTGSVYSRDELAALGEVLKGTKALVISDEIYEKLVYGVKFSATASISRDLYERTITVNGLSKSVAMTGWRLGYFATADERIAKAVTKLQSQSTTNPCSIVQKAAIAALDGRSDKDIEAMRQRFEKRRDLALGLISKIDGLKPIAPDGAFYLFVSHEALEKDSTAFCLKLLDEYGVVCTPGIGFSQEGYFRMSFAANEEVIEKAIAQIAKFADGYRR
ncbi:MAG: pyridoxal phosphate-dependent aminotransferase [Helicobacteraceae bacterium]|nr:pyridoxal phosphate-dependent aminotransferase [Helicobacteraceae bacterium]